MAHIPVLQKEVIGYLDPQPNENFIDCTFGEGGHSKAILEKIKPNGKVLGIDLNPEAPCVHGNFKNLKEIVVREKFPPAGRHGKNVSGILFDLGMSSGDLEESGRGFSFQKNEPLDMRYDIRSPLTAEKIINYWSYQDIERILREYGEETFTERIAKEIIEARKIKPIKTTSQLVEIIKRATPVFYQRKKIHFATKTFQAIRIAVNDELNSLNSVLPQALELLERGGRMIVISFHSLEDRIVKNFLRDGAKEGLVKIITKKPIVPQEEEIKINPRSRSAKLRAAIKL